MNQVSLVGRLVKDPNFFEGKSDCCFVRLAVDNSYKDEGADFIECVAFGNTAKNISRYLTKGRQIGVTGSLDSNKKEDKPFGELRVKIHTFEFLDKKPKEESDRKVVNNVTQGRPIHKENLVDVDLDSFDNLVD